MTDIRPQLSSKNPYWIDRHRYYELKHFCLQYKTWKRFCREIDGIKSQNFSEQVFSKNVSNPVIYAVEKREEYAGKIMLVENAAKKASPELFNYILKAVTEDVSYENLRNFYQMPASKELYYDLYRRFFWYLDASRK